MQLARDVDVGAADRTLVLDRVDGEVVDERPGDDDEPGDGACLDRETPRVGKEGGPEAALFAVSSYRRSPRGPRLHDGPRGRGRGRPGRRGVRGRRALAPPQEAAAEHPSPARSALPAERGGRSRAWRSA